MVELAIEFAVEVILVFGSNRLALWTAVIVLAVSVLTWWMS